MHLWFSLILQYVSHTTSYGLSNWFAQPLGRILGVFGKDIDVLDNQLSGTWAHL
jgi:hypothetical protein